MMTSTTSNTAQTITGTPTLGRKLSTLRAERRLTLREVAIGCGLAESFLSKLERDKVNISVGNLSKIASFYRVPIGYFFDNSASRAHAQIFHSSDYQRVMRSNPSVKMSSLLPHKHSLDAVLIETPPGETESSHHTPCDGEEFTYLINGKLRYWVDSEEYLMEPGDTIVHSSNLPHRWENIGNEDATAISVCLPNQFGSKS